MPPVVPLGIGNLGGFAGRCPDLVAPIAVVDGRGVGLARVEIGGVVPGELLLDDLLRADIEEPGLWFTGFGVRECQKSFLHVDLFPCQAELFGPAEAGETGEFGGVAPFVVQGGVQSPAFLVGIKSDAQIIRGWQGALAEGGALDEAVA